MTQLETITRYYQKTLLRFEEILDTDKTDIIIDAAIYRFKLTLDLSWKMLKAFLEEKKGIICASPKECFRESYRQKIIEYDENWLKLVDMRNETVHTYKEEVAKKIYAYLPEALKLFEALKEEIKNI